MEDTNKVNSELSNDNIRSLVYVIRNKQVMLDDDLARLYQIETRALNQSVKRNVKRFPEEFCFQLTDEENRHLKSQNVMASSNGHEMYMPLPNKGLQCFLQCLEVMLQ